MSPYGLDDGECFFSEEIDTATTFKHESCNCLPAVRPVPLVGYLSGSAVVKHEVSDSDVETLGKHGCLSVGVG